MRKFPVQAVSAVLPALYLLHLLHCPAGSFIHTVQLPYAVVGLHVPFPMLCLFSCTCNQVALGICLLHGGPCDVYQGPFCGFTWSIYVPLFCCTPFMLPVSEFFCCHALVHCAALLQ